MTAPTRLTRFRQRPCPECGAMMRCRPGFVEGVAMLTWHCFEHGYWTDEPEPEATR